MPFLRAWGRGAGAEAFAPQRFVLLTTRTDAERRVVRLNVHTAPEDMKRARVPVVTRTARPAALVAQVRVTARTARPADLVPTAPVPIGGGGPPAPNDGTGVLPERGAKAWIYQTRVMGLEGFAVRSMEAQGGYERGRATMTVEVDGDLGAVGEVGVVVAHEALTQGTPIDGVVGLPRMTVTGAVVRRTAQGVRTSLTLANLARVKAEQLDLPIEGEFLPWLAGADLNPREAAEREREAWLREQNTQGMTCEEREALNRAQAPEPVLVTELLAWLAGRSGVQVRIEGKPYDGDVFYPGGEHYGHRGAQWVGADFSVKGKRPLEALTELLSPLGYVALDREDYVVFTPPPPPLGAFPVVAESVEDEYRNSGTGLSPSPVAGAGPFTLPVSVRIVAAAQVKALPYEDVQPTQGAAELDADLETVSVANDANGKLVSITTATTTKRGGVVVAEGRVVQAYLDPAPTAGLGAPKRWGVQEQMTTKFTYGVGPFPSALVSEESKTYGWAPQIDGMGLTARRLTEQVWDATGFLSEKRTVNTTLVEWQYLGFSLDNSGPGGSFGVKLFYRPIYADEITTEKWVELGRGLWRHTLDVLTRQRIAVTEAGQVVDTVVQSAVVRVDSSVSNQAPPSTQAGGNCEKAEEARRWLYEEPLTGERFTGGRGERMELSLPFVTEIPEDYYAWAVGNRAQPMARRTYTAGYFMGFTDLERLPGYTLRVERGALKFTVTAEVML